MMNAVQNDINVWGLKVIYKATMELYAEHFRRLELALKYTPKNEQKPLQSLILELEEAMQKDLSVFERAVEQPVEDLDKMNDSLCIQTFLKRFKI